MSDHNARPGRAGDGDALVRRLYDVHCIRQLAIEYAIAMDERVARLFVADVRTGNWTGRAVLAAQLGASTRTSRLSVMSVSNHRITFNAADGGPLELTRASSTAEASRTSPERWSNGPSDQPPAKWPDNSTGVGTLPYELPT